MSGERVTLNELIGRGELVVNDGYRTKSSELGPSGFPILRVAEVKDGRLEPSFQDHVRAEFRRKIGNKLASPQDVVVTTKGTVGRVARIPKGSPPFVYSPQVCFLRVTGTTIDPGWLYQWLRGPEFVGQAAGVQDQTDMAAYINLADLKRMRMSLPDIEQQRWVAATLGALDDKIESNRRTRAIMVNLARTLISDGASSVRVGDVADVVKGLSYKGSGLAKREGGAKPMINLANFATDGWMKTSGLKYYNGDYRERHVLRAGDLIIANTDLTQQRIILGRPLLAPPSCDGALFSHHTSLIRFSDKTDLILPLWAQLNGSNFRERAEGYATGTTVASLPPAAVLDFEVRVPDDPRALQEARDLVERAWALEREDEVLIQLRDALLPELMSGRIRVPEAREAVEDAVS
jgi:type I restriction enzyme S subunit